MTTNRRRRELARAKYQRQSLRRAAEARRRRRVSWVLGGLLGVTVATLVVWAVVALMDSGQANPAPQPAQVTLPSQAQPPTTAPATTAPATRGDTGTSPAAGTTTPGGRTATSDTLGAR